MALAAPGRRLPWQRMHAGRRRRRPAGARPVDDAGAGAGADLLSAGLGRVLCDRARPTHTAALTSTLKGHGIMQGLYLVTPNWDDTARLLAVTEQALQAGRPRAAPGAGRRAAGLEPALRRPADHQ